MTWVETHVNCSLMLMDSFVPEIFYAFWIIRGHAFLRYLFTVAHIDHRNLIRYLIFKARKLPSHKAALHENFCINSETYTRT